MSLAVSDFKSQLKVFGDVVLHVCPDDRVVGSLSRVIDTVGDESNVLVAWIIDTTADMKGGLGSMFV